MALIKCPECGRDVSNKAEKCIHCGYPLQESIDIFSHSWRCVNCGEMTYSLICSNCGQLSTEELNKLNTPQYAISDVVTNDSPMEQTPITNDKDSNDSLIVNNTNQSAKNKKGGSELSRTIGALIAIIIFSYLVVGGFGSIFGSSYYVAKHPSYSAASVQIDGYMHKSKSCCQKVADTFGAKVIKVKPDQKAGTNGYGQTVKYKDCFYYCPLCDD